MSEYNWVVTYRGSEEHVHPENGWAGVDIPNVDKLIVYNVANPSQHYVVHCDEGVRPIFYWSVFNALSITGEARGETRTTNFGWQKTVNGTNVKSICRIHHDDSVSCRDGEPT